MITPPDPVLHLPLMPDTPQRNPGRQHAREKRAPVGFVIAQLPVQALALVVRPHVAVSVEDAAIHEVEDVGKDDGRQGQDPPICAQPLHTKRLGNGTGEAAEEEAVRQAREPGEQEEPVRVGDAEPAHLGEQEDERRGKEAPGAREMQARHDEVGADA